MIDPLNGSQQLQIKSADRIERSAGSRIRFPQSEQTGQ